MKRLHDSTKRNLLEFTAAAGTTAPKNYLTWESYGCSETKLLEDFLVTSFLWLRVLLFFAKHVKQIWKIPQGSSWIVYHFKTKTEGEQTHDLFYVLVSIKYMATHELYYIINFLMALQILFLIWGLIKIFNILYLFSWHICQESW